MISQQNSGIFSPPPCRPCQPCSPLTSSLPQRPPEPQTQVEYIKVQRKVVEYVEQWVEEVVAVKKTVYDQRKIIREVPVQKKVKDFFKIETITEYMPQAKSSAVMKEIKVPKYIPKPRQIIHCSEGLLQQIKRGNVVFQPALNNKIKNAVFGNSIPKYEQAQLQRKSSTLPIFSASSNNLQQTKPVEPQPAHPASSQQGFFSKLSSAFGLKKSEDAQKSIPLVQPVNSYVLQPAQLSPQSKSLFDPIQSYLPEQKNTQAQHSPMQGLN